MQLSKDIRTNHFLSIISLTCNVFPRPISSLRTIERFYIEFSIRIFYLSLAPCPASYRSISHRIPFN